MIRVTLPGTDMTVSRFSFGTASLHHNGTHEAQVAHLRAAADAGFTHFDTAPLYGFGAAERALGEAFGTHDGVTIATKVGIYAPGGSDQGRLSMLTRKVAGKALPAMSRAVADLNVAKARASVDASLRRLRRDHLDLLLLHEPDMALMDTDEWARWIETAGDKVRAIGVAGPPEVMAPFLAAQSPLAQVLQCQDSLTRKEADVVTSTGRDLQLTYGYFSGNQGAQSAADLLRGALLRNTAGSVVVTTRKPERLGQFAKIAADAAAQNQI